MERKHLLVLTYTKISHLIILIRYSRFNHLFNFFPADFFHFSSVCSVNNMSIVFHKNQIYLVLNQFIQKI